MFEEFEKFEKALKLLAERKEREREDVKLAYELIDMNRKSTYELIDYLARFLPPDQQIKIPPDKK